MMPSPGTRQSAHSPAATRVLVRWPSLSRAAPGIFGEPTPADTSRPDVNTVDPASLQALKKMGAHLQTMQRLQVTAELPSQAVLEGARKLQQSHCPC
ncbi:hypothetical protein [Accumulibacter sp.]|uniref:hypothetical protein n=1 Tax=Accumulibacter sp. TaxID=2053492 RepID=UPI001AD33343|nr:hypothetical protein [Accumulibacter sp.]MBN8498891.1 hypothetical protein [Accumulibacter sp.]